MAPVKTFIEMTSLALTFLKLLEAVTLMFPAISQFKATLTYELVASKRIFGFYPKSG